jgi:hypothetical protein
MIPAQLASQVVAHHLRIFGVPEATLSREAESPRFRILIDPHKAADLSLADQTLAKDGVIVAIRPADGFCAKFGVAHRHAAPRRPAIMKYRTAMIHAWSRLRTLHEFDTYEHSAGVPVVSDANGRHAWVWLPIGRGGILFVGTDLAADLIRYRQGDPQKENARATKTIWGYSGERPLYLFEEQIEGEDPSERHADWWAMALAQAIADRLDRPLAPLLPGRAVGAVVITGDDDQAYLEKYQEQLWLLGDTPITYFLHPQTRHTPSTLRSMSRKRRVDLGIHPDAVNAPARYGELLQEQSAWFKRLTGRAAVSLRNHGYLNDGYWNHLPHWLEAGVRISSNLPGLDGRVLNGSLLPSRLAYGGQLTPHWSVLTAIGDGVRSIQGMSERESADCVWRLADRIRLSALPGVMVLNLHPQNIDDTRMMHVAAMEVVRSGFHAWTMAECLAWFERRDARTASEMQSRLEASMASQIWGRVRSRFL